MLTKSEISEALDQIPVSSIMNKQREKQLTPKQKRFVKEIAINGESKSAAYRKAYNTKAKPSVVGADAQKLSRNPLIALEIERVRLAVERLEYRSPGHLKALVVDSLTAVLLDDGARHSDIINAAKVIGSISGVDMFKEQAQESRAVSSTSARDNLLGELKRLLKRDTADVVDVEAHTLLEELAGAPHPGATPPIEPKESHDSVHSVPHKQPPENLSTPKNPNEINELRSESDSDVPHPSENAVEHTVDNFMETPTVDESDGFHR